MKEIQELKNKITLLNKDLQESSGNLQKILYEFINDQKKWEKDHRERETKLLEALEEAFKIIKKQEEVINTFLKRETK